MFFIDRFLLVAAVLLLLGILSSKFSTRMGLPVLVLFLLVGMLAGQAGLAELPFSDYHLAHAIGTVALACILFDGGLRTPLGAIRLAWKPSLSLSVVGVLVTAAVTGVAATYFLGLSLGEGFLLGSIVASTDAAAVFSVLRTQNLHLKDRMAATLEVESGSNDPMAVFLTVGILEMLLGRLDSAWDLGTLFVLQMGVGALVGLFVGWASSHLVNRINLSAAGLYPVLTITCGFLAYSLAATLGGSGFLSVYLAGIVMGNSRLIFRRGTLFFHDGIAWIGQIAMFIVLGVLSSPAQLAEIALPALAVAAVLVLLARPVAVFLSLIPFGFSLREQGLLSLGGIKGAVPIILATYPLFFGLEKGALLFHVVFFVVLCSAFVQGASLPWISRWLGLQEPGHTRPPLTLEITSLRELEADIVEYTVLPGAPSSGEKLSHLGLPEGVVVALIARGDSIIPPRGSTVIEPYDHVFVVAGTASRDAVDSVFSLSAEEQVSNPDEESLPPPAEPLASV